VVVQLAPPIVLVLPLAMRLFAQLLPSAVAPADRRREALAVAVRRLVVELAVAARRPVAGPNAVVRLLAEVRLLVVARPAQLALPGPARLPPVSSLVPEHRRSLASLPPLRAALPQDVQAFLCAQTFLRAQVIQVILA
jgi:hypothetical protein